MLTDATANPSPQKSGGQDSAGADRDPWGIADFDCSRIEELGIERQTNLRAAAILRRCRGVSAQDSDTAPPVEVDHAPSFARADAFEQLSSAPMYGGVDVNLITGAEFSPRVTQHESAAWGHGNTVVVVYVDSRGGNLTPSNRCGVSVSTDGGATFARLPQQFNGLGVCVGAPSVFYSVRAAKWFASFITSGTCGVGQWESPDGLNWIKRGCVVIHESMVSVDRPTSWVDNNPTSPFFGRQYVAINETTPVSQKVQVAVSTDDGVTWTRFTVTSIFRRSLKVFGTPANDGTVFVQTLDEGGGGLTDPRQNFIYRSTNGGVNWTEIQQGATFLGPGRGECATSGLAGMYNSPVSGYWTDAGWGQPGVGPNGVVHYAYSAGGTDPGNIFYIRSTDNGSTWSEPVRLNTDTTTRAQWMPSLSVNSQGAVFVSWYDERNTTDDSLQRYGRASLDNGATWQEDLPLSDVSFPKPLQPDPGIEPCKAGFYNHAAFSDDNNGADAYHTWTDGRLTASGQPQQNVFFDKIALQPSPTPSPSPTPVCVTTTFTNSTPIAIPASGTSGQGSPYPSFIFAFGLNGNITNVTVTLHNIAHTYPEDIDVLLVGPGGRQSLLVSDVGEDLDANNITLTLDDSGPPLPVAGSLTSGTFRPTNYGSPDNFATQPSPNGATALAIFRGVNPGGVWSLYAVDDAGQDIGQIAGGWSLSITTDDACVAPTPTPTPTPTTTPTPTPTPTPTSTPTPTPTTTPTPAPTPTPMPAISINDVSVTEGNTGTTSAVFTVSLPKPSDQMASVSFETADSTTNADSDYVPVSGVLTFDPGETEKTITVPVNGDMVPESTETFFVNLSNAAGATIDDAMGIGSIVNDDALATFRFSAASYAAPEDCSGVLVTVDRSGDTSLAMTVDYATANGSASDRSDYTAAFGTLRFAAGEASKTFLLLLGEDSRAEGTETATVALSNPTGGAIVGSPSTATLVIIDDATEPSTNAIDDAQLFVCQHYHDFLNREPDAAGLAFWTNQITSCGSDQACIRSKRENVSAAFFLSIEFQGTGFYALRFYRAALNRHARFREFLRDAQEIGRGVAVGQGAWEAQLEARKGAFAEEFVARPEFAAVYAGLSNGQYVDALNANTNGSLSQSERNALVAGLDSLTETRATVLRKVVEDADFVTRETNPAFVLLQYFGYLRRNPDDPPDPDFGGFNFWLTKLDQFNGDFRKAEMVKAFLLSIEYRSRFD